jgi:polar amino acid transport system substrate-binding protein
VTTRHPTRLLLAAAASSLLLLTACGSSTGNSGSSAVSTSGSPTTVSGPLNSGPRSSIPLVSRGTGVLPSVSMAAGQECGVPEAMPTRASGTLTIATSEPAFDPWMVDNDPTNGNGFESAVAYAVADRLGYLPAQVTWTRVGFDEAIAKPGGFDFDINQFTITDDRRKQVDFSSGYYTVAQTVITVDGSAIGDATTIADLKDAQLGAMNGTTSLDAINTVIAPTKEPQVFDDNALAAQALQNGQIDGLVVDLPTAFYMTGAQLTDGKVIGQLKAAGGEAEQLGLLLAKDSPLTSCVTAAVDSLRTDGTLDALADKWLAGADTAPVLN